MNLLENIETSLPPDWVGLFQVITFPVAWLFPFQGVLLDAAWNSDYVGLSVFKRVFFFLPAVSTLIGLWCTMLGVYTIVFRENRVKFIVTLQILWWDVARCTLFFWAGMARFVWIAFGSFFGMIRLVVEVMLEMIREIFELPFTLTGSLAKNFRQPGVPWLAFLLTVSWCVVEAIMFTYILAPTFSEVLSDLVGSESHRFLGLFLFIILGAMIGGSFACMHVLTEAANKRNYKQVVQMLIVEFFVMFVEVIFLYRELIDALTPWIAQQTGIEMGIVPVILFASFGWLGVRGTVWFLFARFGTPTMLAIIARQRLPEEEQVKTSTERSEARWDKVVDKLKNEQGWFTARAQMLIEAATLPIFQVIAAGINFMVVLFTNQPLFNLPFKTLAEVGETKALLQSLASQLSEKS